MTPRLCKTTIAERAELLREYVIIPAAPGWFVSGLIGGDEPPSLYFDPIIAWAVHADKLYLDDKRSYLVIKPITIEGSVSEDDVPLIKRPDGAFEDPFTQFLDTEENAIRYLVEQKERTERAKANIKGTT